MFENMTFENILNDMLSRVTSDVDKREGSVIYDALAPCAYELSQAYFNLNFFLDLVSGDTAIGPYLDRVVADYGLARKAATKAVRKIETSGSVNIGTRWGLNDTTYIITELITQNSYKAECDQLGEIGNRYSGTLENIDNVSGITATLTDIITSGQDKETDENLRARFYAQIQRPSTSGNADNYKKWALEVPGVGDAKVFPVWNGPGTVKVIVVDENMDIDETLPTMVSDYIEIVRPIGANVVIDGPQEKAITIKANLKLGQGYNIQNINLSFLNALKIYKREIIFKDSYVSYALIGKLLFDVPGVIDYDNLTLNDLTQNITLAEDEIPKFNVELGVM